MNGLLPWLSVLFRVTRHGQGVVKSLENLVPFSVTPGYAGPFSTSDVDQCKMSAAIRVYWSGLNLNVRSDSVRRDFDDM